MRSNPSSISDVSETALWVATYRSMESERPDALFRDPYARRLAGARGEEIMRSVSFGRSAAAAMIVRTKVFDEIIVRLVDERGVDEVLNLACGLDARAYRMALPRSLRWTDVDFPDLIAYRQSVLVGEQAACVYEAAGVDLSDVSAGSALFDRVAARSKRVLVVSEGLLLYLTPDAVGSLATALAARPMFAYWLADLNGPMAVRMMNRMWGRHVKAGTARFLFGPNENTKFFERYGWREAEYHSLWDASRRLDRGVWFYKVFGLILPLLTPKAREFFRRSAGAALLERAQTIGA